MIKDFYKKTLDGVTMAIAFCLTVGTIVYAATIANVTTQIISSGDTIGAGWFQDVNDKLNTMTSSLGASGYQILPGGLIIQWGKITNPGTSSTTVTFPISFKENIYNVQVSREAIASNTGGFTDAVGISTVATKTGFVATHPSTANYNYYWLALGK